VPTYERTTDRAARRASRFLVEVGEELRRARRRQGRSQRSLAAAVGLSQSELSRIEHGKSQKLSLTSAARILAAAGLDLSVRVYPGGAPLRDIAQVKLMARLRAEVHPKLRWRTEVPIPIAGDQRAFDAVIDGAGVLVAIECVTRLEDAQGTERAINGKQRDAAIPCLVLVLAATRHNRAAVAAAGQLRNAFPLGNRAVLAALRAGRRPAGNGLIFL
jgi:transcriptional regulator with XRE-family HTH domain